MWARVFRSLVKLQATDASVCRCGELDPEFDGIRIIGGYQIWYGSRAEKALIRWRGRRQKLRRSDDITAAILDDSAKVDRRSAYRSSIAVHILPHNARQPKRP